MEVSHAAKPAFFADLIAPVLCLHLLYSLCRDRHPNGTYEMMNQFSYHFSTPNDETSWTTGNEEEDKKLLKSFIYFSQAGG